MNCNCWMGAAGITMAGSSCAHWLQKELQKKPSHGSLRRMPLKDGAPIRWCRFLRSDTIPLQEKIAVIELDKHDRERKEASLVRIGANGEFKTVLHGTPSDWGNFLRYHYLQFDFSSVKDPGLYQVQLWKIPEQYFSDQQRRVQK